jgi:hypothetical protein
VKFQTKYRGNQKDHPKLRPYHPSHRAVQIMLLKSMITYGDLGIRHDLKEKHNMGLSENGVFTPIMVPKNR